MIIGHVPKQQIETYSNVEANTYGFEKYDLEHKVVPTSLHTSAHERYVLNYKSYWSSTHNKMKTKQQ